MRMTKRLLGMVSIAVCGMCMSAQATLIGVSDDFDDNTGTFSSWVDVGSFATDIFYDSTSANDFDKLDFVDSQGNPLDGDTIVGNLAGDTEPLGDGLLGDGGLRLNTLDTTQGNEAIGLTVGGTMDLGEEISFTATLYNDNLSFFSGRFQLYNLTDSTVLSDTGNTSIQGSGSGTYVPIDFSLAYTAVGTDAGDTLQIRFVENANATSRDGYIDNFALTSIPEPTTFGLMGLFGLAGLLARKRLIA